MSAVASDCDCIVLAAGLSSRSSGHKLLKPIAGRPLVRVAVDNALAACRRVILVVGHEADAVTRAALPPDGAAGGRVQIVHYELFAAGMFSSIQAGVRAVQSEWFFVVPADLPGITPSVYAAVAGAAGAGPGGAASTAVVPFCRGVRGHPVLLHRSLVEPMLEEPADAGPMRSLLSRYSVHRVDLDDYPAISVDLDTDQEYAEYLKRH